MRSSSTIRTGCAGCRRNIKSNGVREILMTQPGPAADVVSAYLAGTLATSPAGFCRCSH
jgi:hypothetical protein